MTRPQLEHIIRAAGTIADDGDVVVIGSQAILGEFPNAPGELLVSNEADVFPRFHVDRSDLIDSTIGEGSPFQHQFGYYAHGIGENTAVLPAGWRERLVLVSGENTRFMSLGARRTWILRRRWSGTGWSRAMCSKSGSELPLSIRGSATWCCGGSRPSSPTGLNARHPYFTNCAAFSFVTSVSPVAIVFSTGSPLAT
jgi:hypothetical protein